VNSNFTVIFDACVLYPAPLRDVLLEVASQGIFRARWTDQIHDEWIRNLLKNRPDLKPEQLARTRLCMNNAIPDCLVTGYEKLIGGLDLPDPNDGHVLAAAIAARADVIVTFNTKHFPQEQLESFGIEAQHPDDFLVYQFDLGRGAVCQAIKQLRARLKNPPVEITNYLDTLTRQQLSQFVEKLRPFASLL
jgi:predicted nucleic acid-binding protein